MKLLKQFGIIVGISFSGEVLRALIPLPIPASIYGIILLFLALETGLIKLSAVKDVSKFLIEIMPVMFVPAAVGLMDSWGILSENLLVYIVITVITTIVVMVTSGKVTQFMIRKSGKGGKKNA